MNVKCIVGMFTHALNVAMSPLVQIGAMVPDLYYLYIGRDSPRYRESGKDLQKTIEVDILGNLHCSNTCCEFCLSVPCCSRTAGY